MDDKIMQAFTDALKRQIEELKKETSALGEFDKKIKALSDHVDNTATKFNKFSGMLGGLEKQVNSLSDHGFNNFKTILIDQNKRLFDLSRQTTLTGQSFTKLQAGVVQLSKTTHLSIAESTKFYKTVQDNTRGLKLSTVAVNDFAKALSSEFGPTLEDVTEAMNDLLAVQNKDVLAFDRLAAGMDPQAASAYASAMEGLFGITKKQGDAIIRTSIAMGKQGDELTEQEKKLNDARIAQQNLNKAWEDVKLNWADKLATMLPKIDTLLSKLVNSFKMIPGWAVKMLLGGAVIGGGLGVAAVGIGALSKAKNFLFNRTPAGAARLGGGGGGGLLGGGGGVGGTVGVYGTFGAPVRVIVMNGMPGFGGAPGAPPRIPGANTNAPGAGMAGTNSGISMGRVIGFGIAGSLIQMGGGALSEHLNKTGREKAGNAVSGLSGVASSAAHGAVIGSVIPGIGTAVGALGGTIVGVVSNFDSLAKMVNNYTGMFESYNSANSAATDEVNRLSEAIGSSADLVPSWSTKITGFVDGLGRGDGGKKNTFGQVTDFLGVTDEKDGKAHEKDDVRGQSLQGYVEKKYGDKREWGSLSSNEKNDAEDESKAAHHLQKTYGTNKDDTSAIVATSIKEILAKEAVSKMGLTGKKADAAVRGYTTGTIDKQSEEYLKITEHAKAGGNLDKAFNQTKNNLGAYAKGPDADKAKKDIFAENEGILTQRIRYEQINGVLEARLHMSEKIISANERILKLAMDDRASGEEILRLMHTTADEHQHNVDLLKLTLKFKQMINDTSPNSSIEKADARLLEMAKQQGIAANDVATIRKMGAADELSIQGKIADEVMKIRQATSETMNFRREEKSLADSEIDILQSEMDLTKAMYLGLGPTLDKQDQLIGLLEKKKALLDDEIAQGEKLRAQGELSNSQQTLLNKKINERKQTEMKELEITKNLREGYLEAMGAFTNVSGAFSKIILKKEMGMGEMARRFGSGGFRTGTTGAGSNDIQASFKKGGSGLPSLDINSEAVNKTRESYGEMRTLNPNRVNVAAMAKDANIQDEAGAMNDGVIVPNRRTADKSISSDFLPPNPNKAHEDTDKEKKMDAKVNATTPSVDKSMSTSVTEGINNSELSKFILSGKAPNLTPNTPGAPGAKPGVGAEKDARLESEIQKKIDIKDKEISKKKEYAESHKDDKAAQASVVDAELDKNGLEVQKNEAIKLGTPNPEAVGIGAKIKSLDQQMATNSKNAASFASTTYDPGHKKQWGSGGDGSLLDYAGGVGERWITESTGFDGGVGDDERAGTSHETVAKHHAAAAELTKKNEGLKGEKDVLVAQQAEILKKQKENEDKREELLKKQLENTAKEEQVIDKKDATQDKKVQTPQEKTPEQIRSDARDQKMVDRGKEWKKYFAATNGEQKSSPVTIGHHGSVVAAKRLENNKIMNDHLDRASRSRTSEMGAIKNKIAEYSGNTDDFSVSKTRELQKHYDLLKHQESHAPQKVGGASVIGSLRQNKVKKESEKLQKMERSRDHFADNYSEFNGDGMNSEQFKSGLNRVLTKNGVKDPKKLADQMMNDPEMKSRKDALQLPVFEEIKSTINDEIGVQRQILEAAKVTASNTDSLGGGSMSGPGTPENSGVMNQNTNLYGIANSFLGGMGMATGGFVGGTGSGDTVPAMLTPGEFVLNQKASKKFGPFLAALNKNHLNGGGFVSGLSPSPATASGGGGGSGMPNISLNVKGDTVNKIMKATMTQLQHHVSRMVTPSGTTSRFFDKGR